LKRTIAWLLLGVFLHNLLGYYLFYAWRQARLAQTVAQKLPSLPEQSLQLIKIPVPLYHQPDRPHAEPIQGEFEHQGRFYQLVKQQLVNDTLLVYCYQNHEKAQLIDELAQHQETQAAPLDAKNAPGKSAKSEKPFAPLKDYLPLEGWHWPPQDATWPQTLVVATVFPVWASQLPSDPALGIITPPPRA
jgi:hypothetical protein